MFAQRIVGLRFGEVVYDGPPNRLTPSVLNEIYGEEDWNASVGMLLAQPKTPKKTKPSRLE